MLQAGWLHRAQKQVSPTTSLAQLWHQKLQFLVLGGGKECSTESCYSRVSQRYCKPQTHQVLSIYIKRRIWDSNYLRQLTSCRLLSNIACAMWPAHHERRQKRDSLRERTAGSGLQRQVCFSVNSCSCPTLKECHNIIIRGKKKRAAGQQRQTENSFSISQPNIPSPCVRNKTTPFSCLPQSTNCQTNLLGRMAVSSQAIKLLSRRDLLTDLQTKTEDSDR